MDYGMEIIKTGRWEMRMAVRSQVKVLSAYIRPHCLLDCDNTSAAAAVAACGAI